jgi:signal transduction histidine kinase
MGQVLQNLVVNALQAMPGGGLIQVSARPESDADFIRITVRDTGPGISAENMERIFQPLFTTKEKGIGLGLVLCRDLMEINGGSISVESEPGKGTEFMIRIPQA